MDLAYKMSNIMEWYRDLMDNKQGNFLIDSCIEKFLRKITSLIPFIYIISYFFYFILYQIVFFRSENGGMVSGIWSRPDFNNYSNVHIYLCIRRTEIYEEQEAV